MRKQDNVADRMRVGQEHREAVDADSLAGRGRHSVTQRPHVVFVHGMRFVVAAFPRFKLRFETGALVDGVVEFRIGVGKFPSPR